MSLRRCRLIVRRRSRTGSVTVINALLICAFDYRFLFIGARSLPGHEGARALITPADAYTGQVVDDLSANTTFLLRRALDGAYQPQAWHEARDGPPLLAEEEARRRGARLPRHAHDGDARRRDAMISRHTPDSKKGRRIPTSLPYLPRPTFLYFMAPRRWPRCSPLRPASSVPPRHEAFSTADCQARIGQ